MPYINKLRRQELDPTIKELSDYLEKGTVGDLNYTITSLVDKFVASQEKVNYEAMNAAIGVLECAKQELYRRVIAIYEDQKMKQSGDAYSLVNMILFQEEMDRMSRDPDIQRENDFVDD
jgi:hypothetical protein